MGIFPGIYNSAVYETPLNHESAVRYIDCSTNIQQHSKSSLSTSNGARRNNLIFFCDTMPLNEDVKDCVLHCVGYKLQCGSFNPGSAMCNILGTKTYNFQKFIQNTSRAPIALILSQKQRPDAE